HAEERRPRIAQQRSRLAAGDEGDHPPDEYRYRGVDQRDNKTDNEQGGDQTARLPSIMPVKRNQSRRWGALRWKSGRFEKAFKKPEQAHGGVRFVCPALRMRRRREQP